MKVRGELSVDVTYRQQHKRLTLIVVAGTGPSLFGRNWLKYIQLDWKKIAIVAAVYEDKLQTLLHQYEDLFKEGLGTITSYQAKLQMQKDAIPKFFKPRPVPFAIKAAIENELGRLEAAGAIVKVDCSDWAAPIVPVPKKDGTFSSTKEGWYILHMRRLQSYHQSRLGSGSVPSSKT